MAAHLGADIDSDTPPVVRDCTQIADFRMRLQVAWVRMDDSPALHDTTAFEVFVWRCS